MFFRNFIAHLAGWERCNFEEYANIFNSYGGCLITHPNVVAFLMNNTENELKFYRKMINGKAVAAIFVNDEMELCAAKTISIFFSSDEIIFPAHKDAKFFMPFKSKVISCIHSDNIINLLPRFLNKRKICIGKNEFSKKTKKNRINEVNKFIRQGGEIYDSKVFSSAEICDIYRRVYKLRWGHNISHTTLSLLINFLEKHHDMLFGHVLFMNNEPCAYDLVIFSDGPNCIYFDVPNGGYDPQYENLSVGSVLMWLNINKAILIGKETMKPIKFSLGKPTMEYKMRWCKTHDLYRTI